MDFEQYMEKTLLEMQNLDDRKGMRQILQEVLIPLYQYSEKKYQQLEQNVLMEAECTKVSYNIVTGIIDRKKYDVTLEEMKLMNPDDIEEKKVNLTEAMEAIKQKKPYLLFSVFIRADYTTIRRLQYENRRFHGIIRTRTGEYKAVFNLKKNEAYLKQVHELYRIFTKNSIGWKTVCAPYLHKIFDVYLCEAAPTEDEEIEEIVIQFEEFEPFVRYDYVPIWNLQVVQERSSAIPVPCKDQIHYQHQIFRERIEDTDYLVMNEDIPILNQRRVNGDIMITCRESKAVKWKLLKFNRVTKTAIEEVLMHNIGGEEPWRRVRTKAALAAFIQTLGYSRYMELRNITTCEGDADHSETYQMDDFIIDEIILRNNSHTLIFEFKQMEPDFYLNQDILSYIVSKLQWEYPEYHCVGRFV